MTGGASEHARTHAVAIVRALRDRGHVAYLAGGCVRDELLGLDPTDYDVATNATPDRIASIFPRTSLVGAAFGVVLIHHGRDGVGRGLATEVATFRRDFGYGDKRRPDRVEFTDAEHDAQRRDFTINALFLDPLETRPDRRVIDYVGGAADIERGVVRAVGDPAARLDEDHLRALRAVRFACRLGFTLDPATSHAITAHASELAGVSRERIGDEIRKMFAPPSRGEAARLLSAHGLDAPALDEPADVDAEPRLVAALPPEASLAAALAAWALDRHGEAEAPAAAKRWRAALCLSNDERDALERCLETFSVLASRWEGMTVAEQKRTAAARSFPDALAVLGVAHPDRAGSIGARLAELAEIGMGMWPAPLLDGDALIAMGLSPGPHFARILNGLLDAQLDGRVTDRAGAEAFVRELSQAGGV